jgi:hypothetical protein
MERLEWFGNHDDDRTKVDVINVTTWGSTPNPAKSLDSASVPGVVRPNRRNLSKQAAPSKVG